jgi:hypothetical protein
MAEWFLAENQDSKLLVRTCKPSIEGVIGTVIVQIMQDGPPTF